MAIHADLSKYFTKEAVAQLLKDSEPVRTPIWSRVFPKVRQHPLAHISKKTLIELTGNVPLIKRGTPSIGIDGAEDTAELFEPQPIAVNTVLKAKDFLDLYHINNVESIQEWVGDKLLGLRDRIYLTIEALCCQAITGLIDYPIKIYEGDLGSYKVNFGPLINPATYAGFTGAWGAQDLETIFKDLLLMSSAISDKTRYGSKIGFLAGRTAFYTLVGKLQSSQTTTKVDLKIEKNKVLLNGFEIEYLGGAEYTDLHTGSKVKAIGDNDLFIFAEDAPFQMNYLAIDDFDANEGARLVARPFFPKQIKQEDPSAYKILAQSKPFPIPVPLASISQDVIS